MYWRDSNNQLCIDLDGQDGFKYCLPIHYYTIEGMEIQQIEGKVTLKILANSTPQQLCKSKGQATTKSKGVQKGERVWRPSSKDFTNHQLSKNRLYTLETTKAINIVEWKKTSI